MDRLTMPDEPIEGGMRRSVVDARAVKEQAMTIYWRLKEYEDTGLTPTEIMDGKMLTGWIPVTEQLPEDDINPITQDAYVYPVTVEIGNVRDVRYFSFCNGHWYNCGPNPMDNVVLAWMSRPEPFNLTKKEKCGNCGNCVWHIPCSGDWICSCEDSEAYGQETEYTDACNEFHDINF